MAESDRTCCPEYSKPFFRTRTLIFLPLYILVIIVPTLGKRGSASPKGRDCRFRDDCCLFLLPWSLFFERFRFGRNLVVNTEFFCFSDFACPAGSGIFLARTVKRYLRFRDLVAFPKVRLYSSRSSLSPIFCRSAIVRQAGFLFV